MARAVTKGEPKARVKEQRAPAPHDETSETLGNLTLCAVAVLYGVLIAVGYFSGATPEDTQIRALAASAAVGAVGWFLTEIVCGLLASPNAPRSDGATLRPAKNPVAEKDETA